MVSISDMKTIASLILFLCCSLTLVAQINDEEKIRKMLADQVTEWNRGNIAGYMKGYWEHDSLVFIGKNGPTYGYKQTLARYQRSYPDPEAMGQLTSTVLTMKKLCGDYYFVTGRWFLQRKAGDLAGSYTLLIRRIGGEWVIINDHSS